VNNNGIKKEQVEKYGEVAEFDHFKTVLKIPRDSVKNVASEILSSDLPVDDIMIDEADLDDVIRKIFAK